MTNKLFITHWPFGKLKLVDVIEEREDRKGYFYIRYESGKTDTTSAKFLLDIPDELIAQQAQELEQANKRNEALEKAGNDVINTATFNGNHLFNASVIRWDKLVSNTKGEG